MQHIQVKKNKNLCLFIPTIHFPDGAGPHGVAAREFILSLFHMLNYKVTVDYLTAAAEPSSRIPNQGHQQPPIS